MTEYDGKSKGNAAPERTSNLSSKLYARTIAVDSSGNIYVGYLDNQYGYSFETGDPDPTNEIAIYAPNASGNDQPTAVLVENKNQTTATTLFPIFISFDPSGRLVTYGATVVDGNAGDAVLTYPVGSTGDAVPEYGWNFGTPTLRYSGPTGLAVDSGQQLLRQRCAPYVLGPSDGLFVNPASQIGEPNRYPVTNDSVERRGADAGPDLQRGARSERRDFYRQRGHGGERQLGHVPGPRKRLRGGSQRRQRFADPQAHAQWRLDKELPKRRRVRSLGSSPRSSSTVQRCSWRTTTTTPSTRSRPTPTEP